MFIPVISIYILFRSFFISILIRSTEEGQFDSQSDSSRTPASEERSDESRYTELVLSLKLRYTVSGWVSLILDYDRLFVSWVFLLMSLAVF
jgi:hypothetical protein